ncbi:MAG: hypothetical protein ACJAT2_001417 [Bacteriovoracaceae bacterium]|jgi:hypothetical protein
MEKFKEITENINWKLKDTFFFNLIIGFVIFNYKFIYILINQPMDNPGYQTAANLIDSANQFLNIYSVLLYSILVTFLYPILGVIVIKWRHTVEYYKERWLEKSFPTNDLYRSELEEISKLNLENTEVIKDFGSRMISECNDRYKENNWNFYHFTSIEGSRFKEGDIAVTTERQNKMVLTSLRNYNEERTQLKYIYCKIDDNNYITTNIDQFCFQSKDFLDNNAKYLILTRNGIKYCDQSEYDYFYQDLVHEVIFSIEKNQNSNWQHVLWPN